MAKILIAEDDKFLVKIYETKLLKAGNDIVIANDGEEAIEKIKKEKPDIVLLDIIMPKKSGLDVLAEIKKDPELRGIPVVALSNLGQEGDMEKSIEAGAIDHIVKANISIDDLVAKVKGYIKSSQLDRGANITTEEPAAEEPVAEAPAAEAPKPAEEAVQTDESPGKETTNTSNAIHIEEEPLKATTPPGEIPGEPLSSS